MIRCIIHARSSAACRCGAMEHSSTDRERPAVTWTRLFGVLAFLDPSFIQNYFRGGAYAMHACADACRRMICGRVFQTMLVAHMCMRPPECRVTSISLVDQAAAALQLLLYVESGELSSRSGAAPAQDLCTWQRAWQCWCWRTSCHWAIEFSEV